MTSQAANFIWETKIKQYFPKGQERSGDNLKQENSYQQFNRYFLNNNPIYKTLTKEEKIIFSHLKKENIHALNEYNDGQSRSLRAPIRFEQIPFECLEWVARNASQDFKNYLYEQVYQILIESTDVNNFFKLLVRGSRLFARPRVEVVAQPGNEKSFGKKQ